MKCRITILLLTLMALNVKAQSNHYALQIEQGTYTELGTNARSTGQVFADGDPFEVKELYGNTFNLWNKPMLMDTVTKGVLIFPNAFIEVIEDSNFIICDAMLKWLDSIDQASNISYAIDGSGDRKVLKVQWKNLKIRTGKGDNYVNVQIWLYQYDGMIEYRYGPSSINNASGFNQTTGPSVGISYSTQDFSTMYEKIWIHGTPPRIIVDSGRTVTFPNIWGIPAEGTVYRFIPKMSVSVPKLSATKLFSVYPNPADDRLRILLKTMQAETYNVQICSMQGQVVRRYAHTFPKELLIPTEDIAAGNYLLQFEHDGNTCQQQITIQH